MENVAETNKSREEFKESFLLNRLTGARDAFGFGYDVYGTVKKDLVEQGFDKSFEGTKKLASIISSIFFAFISSENVMESIKDYEQYVPECNPDYDLENVNSAILDVLSHNCFDIEPWELSMLLHTALVSNDSINGSDLNKIVYSMVSYYVNNIDAIICKNDTSAVNARTIR